MTNPSNTLSDHNLEARTMLSLRCEPACFAFLSSGAASAPLPIDAINVDVASVDYFGGRASLWATLEVRSGTSNGQPMAVLGFDETFLRPFTRALIEASASRDRYRMTIVRAPDGTLHQRVVEYVTGPGVLLREVILTPHDAVLGIAARSAADGDEESLFQLPRTDSFLRAFVSMAHKADEVLRDMLLESERIARRHKASLEGCRSSNRARA
jgi:hypothetical protein